MALRQCERESGRGGTPAATDAVPLPVPSPSTHARLSPNGRFLLATTLDGCARLWDVAESTVAKTYRAGHRRHAVQAAFVRGGDGRQAVVVGCEDGSGPGLFDVQTRRVRQRLSLDSASPGGPASARALPADADGDVAPDGSGSLGPAEMAVDDEAPSAPQAAAGGHGGSTLPAMALAVASSLDLRSVAAGTVAGKGSAVLVWRAVEEEVSLDALQ